jgi:hypothetical protein
MRSMVMVMLLVACGGTDDKDTGDAGAGDVVVTVGFDMESRSGTATGDVEDSVCGGWFPATSQLELIVEESITGMHLVVDSTDLVIRVDATTGSWCSNVENYDLPTVSRAVWGTIDHEVFIGTVDEGGSATFDLDVIEGVADAY